MSSRSSTPAHQPPMILNHLSRFEICPDQLLQHGTLRHVTEACLDRGVEVKRYRYESVGEEDQHIQVTIHIEVPTRATGPNAGSIGVRFSYAPGRCDMGCVLGRS